ncbi:DUF3558 family protein [Nocardioides sp.]|uniref:DUF3558 family protein n=1 Tax=Nocardioides sp. TaxID=35761 RepID=UPI0035141502
MSAATTTARGLLLAVLVLAPTGCGGDDAPAPATDPAASTTQDVVTDAGDPGETAGEPAPAPAGAVPDLCSLLTDEELTSLLGTAPEGQFAEGAGGGTCAWYNPTGQFVELAVADASIPPTQGVVEVDGVLFFELAGRDGNVKYVDFETGDTRIDELTALIPAIQDRA